MYSRYLLHQKGLKETLSLLEEWLDRDIASKRDVQKLVGKLNFVASCVRPGRIFISKMLTCLHIMPGRCTVRLSPEFRKDVLW